MDTLKEFWTTIKDRLTSPLFGSFLIIWLVYNYPVPITLIFYKFKELPPEYKSFLDVIEKHNGLWNFLVPLLVAFAYTFVYPFMKGIITVFQGWVLLKTNTYSFEYTHTLPISVEEHAAAVSELEKSKDIYAKLAESRKSTAEANKQLLSDKASLELQLESQKESFDTKISELNTQHDERVKAFQLDSEVRIQDIITGHTENVKAAQNLGIEQIASLQRDITGKAAEILSLKTELQQAQFNFGEVSQQLSESQQELSRVKTALIEYGEQQGVTQTELEQQKILNDTLSITDFEVFDKSKTLLNQILIQNGPSLSDESFMKLRGLIPLLTERVNALMRTA